MTDQLYGSGKAWFEKCKLLSRACGGGSLHGVAIPPIHSSVSTSATRSSHNHPTPPKPRVWSGVAISADLGTPTATPYTSTHSCPTSWQTPDLGSGLKPRPISTPSSPDLPSTALRSRWKHQRERYKLETILSDAAAAKITIHKVFGGSTPWIDLATVKNSSSG